MDTNRETNNFQICCDLVAARNGGLTIGRGYVLNHNGGLSGTLTQPCSDLCKNRACESRVLAHTASAQDGRGHSGGQRAWAFARVQEAALRYPAIARTQYPVRFVYLHPFCSGRLLQDSGQEFSV